MFQKSLVSIFFFVFPSFFFLSLTKSNLNPENYFSSPVNTPILLSGTFGELRSSHFHTGIDIKGAIGNPIFAVADGYVSRVRVQVDGYGKSIYITHPNGYTSVYAHLNNFTKELEAYVKKVQLEKKQFEVEIFPSENAFQYTQGTQIGVMGVTGRSFGPHLHFEIRETKSEKPVNPLLFGFNVLDNIAPIMHQIKLYALNPKHETIFSKAYPLINLGNNKYGIKGDTITIGAWRIGAGIKVYDHMNGASNWNGVYQADLLVDNENTFRFTFEKLSFDEARFINAHIDYSEYVEHKAFVNKCYRLPGNHLSNYQVKVREGVIPLSATVPKKVNIIVQDLPGNQAEITFWVKRDKNMPDVAQPTYNYLLPYNEENIIETKNLHLYFPKGAFYEDLYMQFNSSDEPSNQFYSQVFHVHDNKVPIHRYFDIAITPNSLPQTLMDKAFIAHCDKDGKITNYGGIWKNGRLHSSTRELGDYCIMIDNIPPKITPIAFKENMKGMNKMTFKITDNFDVGGNAKGLEYLASIDGNWALMEYDGKNDLLTYHFDESLISGEHLIRLLVKDNRGNSSVFERQFIR